MTKDQKDIVWQTLPEETRKEMRIAFNEAYQVSDNMYNSGWNDATASLLMKLFGKHNLTGNQLAEHSRYTPIIATADQKVQFIPNWHFYRMELAKELAVAAVSRKGCIDVNKLMDDVDGIVERLKGGQK